MDVTVQTVRHVNSFDQAILRYLSRWSTRSQLLLPGVHSWLPLDQGCSLIDNPIKPIQVGHVREAKKGGRIE
jgi:hypothetical protein